MAFRAWRGYHPNDRFVNTGLLSALTLGVTGTLTAGAVANFGSAFSNCDRFIQTMRVSQVVDGTGGTTTVEVFRTRGGVATSLGTISLAQGGGTNAAATTVPASSALRNIQISDIISVQANAIQSGAAAQTLTVEILYQ